MDWLQRLKETPQEATVIIPMLQPILAGEVPEKIKRPAAWAEASSFDRQTLALNNDWRPEPKAWLTESDELRTQGVFESLAVEIVKLTKGNLPLQAKLLKLHVGIYSGPAWISTILRWKERVAHLLEAEGKQLYEAKLQAAEEMNLLAFADELDLAGLS